MKILEVERGDALVSASAKSVIDCGNGAFLRTIEGHPVAEAPPETGPAIYHNGFRLDRAKPWFPADRVEKADLEPGEAPIVRWKPVRTAEFEKEFRRVFEAIEKGEIEKAVPVLTEEGEIVAGEFDGLMDLGEAGDRGRSFFFSEGDRGMAGITPERLFRIEGRKLQTVALAGTAEEGQGHLLLESAKELSEHRFVADFIESSLGEFGKVKRGSESLKTVGGLVHLMTPLEVTFNEDFDWRSNLDKLIAALHPTPAVGVAPRTETTLRELGAMRERLSTPSWFASPIGYMDGEVCEIFVAIRCLLWVGGRAFLPSGAGIVAGSDLERELDELALKRNAVKEALGIA